MNRAPAFKTALWFIAGIWAGDRFHSPDTFLLSLGGVTICLILSILLKHKIRHCLMALVLFGLGLIHSAILTEWTPVRTSQHLMGKNLTLKAHLIRDPETHTRFTRYWMALDSIGTDDGFRSVPFNFIFNDYHFLNDSLHYGDELRIHGLFTLPDAQRNPGGLNYRRYLRNRNVYAVLHPGNSFCFQKTGHSRGNRILRTLIYPSRRWISETLDSLYHGRSRTFMKALILGDRTDILPETSESFSKIGIIHILSVSGLHVGFVLLLFQSLFGFLRRPRMISTGLVMISLIGYALITEMNPPVARATLMACIHLFGQVLERDTDPLNTIGTAAIILLVQNPCLAFDAGFQLSFSAVISIVLIYPGWKRLSGFSQFNTWCVKRPVIKEIWTLFLISLSAQAGTAPVLLTHFHRTSWIGPAANLFAVPLAGLILEFGLISIILTPLSFWISETYSQMNSLLIELLIRFAEHFQAIPCSSVNLPGPGVLLIMVYLAGLFLIFNWPLRKRRIPLIVFILFMSNIAIWKSAVGNEAVCLTYTQLDVGQGDASVIRLPRRHTVLIDGGNRSPAYDTGERILLPYFYSCGITRIDAVILTHSHNDHVGGLISLVSSIKIGRIICNDTSYTQPMREFLDAARIKKIPVHIVTAPDSLMLGRVILHFISPDSFMAGDPKINNRSIVISFGYGDHRWLLMGDAEERAEIHLIRSKSALQADVIKLGHHGSRSSSSRFFLERVRPRHAVISVGKTNRFGHPSASTIDRLIRIRSEIHRTDLQGAVILKSDGKHLKKIVFNPS